MIIRKTYLDEGCIFYEVSIPEGCFKVIDYYSEDGNDIISTVITVKETGERVDNFLHGKINQLINDYYAQKY